MILFHAFSAAHLNHLMTEPTLKMTVRPAKTQINLGIRPVWSESSDAQADLSLRWAHMPFCWFCHEAAHFKDSIEIQEFL